MTNYPITSYPVTNNRPITILYSQFNSQIKDSQYSKLLNLLPADQRERNQRFIRWQDRHSHLMGRMLLKKALVSLGFDTNCLSNVLYNKYSRPYIDHSIDFNISHSGSYVICAIGQNVKLGVDIESVNDFDFYSLKKIMSEQQWDVINQSENPLKSFFRYWTMKESVIKADSRGLSIPLQDIHINNKSVIYDNKTWHLHEFSVDETYCSCLAINVKNIDIKYIPVDFYDENRSKNDITQHQNNLEIELQTH